MNALTRAAELAKLKVIICLLYQVSFSSFLLRFLKCTCAKKSTRKVKLTWYPRLKRSTHEIQYKSTVASLGGEQDFLYSYLETSLFHDASVLHSTSSRCRIDVAPTRYVIFIITRNLEEYERDRYLCVTRRCLCAIMSKYLSLTTEQLCVISAGTSKAGR